MVISLIDELIQRSVNELRGIRDTNKCSWGKSSGFYRVSHTSRYACKGTKGDGSDGCF